MASPYAGADSFPTTILSPDDGDSRQASAQNIPDQGLADRTIWLQNRRTEDQVRFTAAKQLIDLYPIMNFSPPQTQSFVHAFWNPKLVAWVGVENTVNAKYSVTAGRTWGANQLVGSGADTLHRGASDTAGNMLITTNNTGTPAAHEFNFTTATWTRRTGIFGGGGTPAGGTPRFLVVYEPVAALWNFITANIGSGVMSSTTPDRTTYTYRGVIGSSTEVSLEVAAGNGLLVIIGRIANAATVYTSSNGGVSWTARSNIAHGFPTANFTDSIAYSAVDGLFVACFGNVSTSACKVYTSPDGITWTARGTSTTRCITRLECLGVTYAGLLTTGVVVYSTDQGATWRGAGVTIDTPVWLARSPGQFLAVCSTTVFPSLLVGNGFDAVI